MTKTTKETTWSYHFVLKGSGGSGYAFLRILARGFDPYSQNLWKLMLKAFRYQQQMFRRIAKGFYLKLYIKQLQKAPDMSRNVT